jgi:hypothetical protein
MKNQISRDSFHPEQHYSGVYLQQGRMILDADWNELSDIQKARLMDALRDAISGTNTTGGAIAGGAPRVGGLKVYADPPDSTNILIQPGTLYVEGVAARLGAAAPLAVNAQPEYPIQATYSGQNLRLYADVWERNVTALERSELLDAALHGADTGTRSQTMLQVKWCANSLDPLDENANPSIGTAPLTLKLRLIASSGDPCDPCASQVKVDERLGNYLFRVEVHDYDAASRVLTLKWSRDNGAEACAVAAIPQGFNQGDWVWEYFDTDTERLLGNHFAPSPTKLRGLLKNTCTTPSGANDPKTFIRQWDGALQINLNTGDIVAGTCPNLDRGVALFKDAVANQAQGRVNLTGGVLKVNLELMELELATTGKRFVPGDYWLAGVREAADESGDTVLAAAPPRGVRHHYLLLGEIGVNKKLVAQDDAFRRRMAFPPLSDIVAADVGFSDHCAGLFAGAVNVQQALDNLCAIGAEDIAYLLPNCGANEGKSVKDRLKALLDPDSDGRLTVKVALDNLLCQLNAGSLPYAVPACATSPNVGKLLGLAAGDNNVAPVLDKLLCDFKANDLPLDKGDPDLCSDLSVPEVVTVQDALKILCGKVGGGCAVVATSPDHLGVLLEEFAKSDNATDLWVCLKGGSYPLGAVHPIAGKRSLRLSGEGTESVFITFSGTQLEAAADEVILENLSFTFSTGGGQLAVKANSVQARSCHFSRTSGTEGGPAMITVGGLDGPCRLSWRDSTLYAQVKTTVGKGNKWAGASVVGDAAFSKALLDLGKAELQNDKTAYDTALDTVAKQLIVLPKDTRTAWKAKLDQAAGSTSPVTMRTYSMRVPTATTASMSEALAKDTISYAEAVAAVEDLIAVWVHYVPDYALHLVDQRVGGVIEGNAVDGWLLLGNGVGTYTSPGPEEIGGVTLEGNIIKSPGEDLRVVSNTFAALKANLPGGAVDSEKKVLVAQVPGHGRITLIGNRIEDSANCVTAVNLVAQGNYWHGGAQDLGYALVDRAAFNGNLVEDSQAASRMNATVHTNQLAASGNLLLDVHAMR